MLVLMKRCIPFFLALFCLTILETGMMTEDCDARARSGGRSFGSSPSQQQRSPAMNQQQQQQQQQPGGGFGRGFLGGLAGGALGAMLFGGLFGMGGSGVGFLLPLLLLGGLGFVAYRFFVKRPSPNAGDGSGPAPPNAGWQGGSNFGGGDFGQNAPPPIPPIRDEVNSVEDGLAQIRLTDPGFDEKYFLEVATDVFFQVQAGWTRRDISSFGHLLGDLLASEYEKEFEQMRKEGVFSKLESIATRNVEIVAAGTENEKNFVTVRFAASLLDYKTDEKTNAVIEGSNTVPVKFVEDWTWARPLRTEEWKLEGIQVVEG